MSSFQKYYKPWQKTGENKKQPEGIEKTSEPVPNMAQMLELSDHELKVANNTPSVFQIISRLYPVY